MEITAINQISAYQQAGSVSRNTANRFSREPRNTKDNSAYKVSLSAEGRQQSLASFDRSQQTKEAQQFESNQSLKRMRFMRVSNRSVT